MARKNGIIISISKNRMGRIGRNRCNPHLPSSSIDERGLRICPANFVGKSSIRFQARNREKKFEIPRAHATVFSMEPRGFRYWTGGGGGIGGTKEAEIFYRCNRRGGRRATWISKPRRPRRKRSRNSCLLRGYLTDPFHLLEWPLTIVIIYRAALDNSRN